VTRATITIATTSEMPAHQQHNAIESVNHHRNNGEDACASTATMPSQRGQRRQLYGKQ
jgi:hypothetical protein